MPAAATSTENFTSVEALLGGPAVLRHRLRSRLDAHDLVARGIPRAAAKHLLDHLVLLDRSSALEPALGMSSRTLQRHRAELGKPLSMEQSAKALKFAEVLAKATTVFGSQDEAEAWLERPAMGLDRRRPIDLMATPVGADIVETFLDRLEFGVYA